MLQNVGGVWYERIYPKNGNQNGNLIEKSFTTLFEGPVVVEKKGHFSPWISLSWVYCKESSWGSQIPTDKR